MPTDYEQPVNKIFDLADLLVYRADLHPDKTAYIFLKDGEAEECRVTYQELDRRARSIAARLQSLGIAGERALLLYPPGLNYIAAFFGCLYAGVIAVPLYPPHPARPERTLPRILGVMKNAQPAVSLTISSIFAAASPFFLKIPGGEKIRWLVTDDISDDTASDWRKPPISGDSIAFLQYTSGSTGDPKGVMVSHKNLLCNSALIHNAFQNPDNAHGVIWLPPYHDMGLIGGILQPLYRGFPATIMSPVAFLQKPLRWLQAISRYKATVSGGPNFAYDFCVSKVSQEDRKNLDLSSWEIAFNGSEPVRPDTMARFADAFRDCGFRKEAFYPCYGLAEATLFVSGGAKTELPVISTYEGTALEKHQAVPCPRYEDTARTLVGCGKISPEQQVVIVNPETLRRCAPDEVGEIWISGTSIAKGYWQNPEESRETFDAYLSDTGEGPFLRSGDMGFIQNGELFVTGRRKDLIIIRGRNHYPQDIELTAEQSYPMMRPGCSAAFSVEIEGEEQLIVAAEIERRLFQRRREPDENYQGQDRRGPDRRLPEVDPWFSPDIRQPVNFDEAVDAIRGAVSEHHELQVHAVLLIKPGTIPKTSSGKIQRHLCREGFLNKTLDVVGGGIPEKSSGISEDSLKASMDSSLAALRSAPPEAEAVLIKSYLKYLTAKALKIQPSRFEMNEPLTNLGIDSLRAVEFQHSVEADLGILCPMLRFLEGPSIEELTAEFMKARSEVRGQRSEVRGITSHPLPLTSHLVGMRSAVSGQRSEEKPSHPSPLTSHLSHNQKSLWFIYQLAPKSAAYNLFFAVRIASELDIAALRGAFADLMQRHASLRTVYMLRDSEPVQEIREHAQDGWFTETDASAWTQDMLNERLSQEAHRPFDLEKGPVMRVHLFMRSEKEHILLLNIHHIATDLWSFSVMLDELRTLYKGQAAPINARETTLSGYVRWQEEMLAGPEGEALWRYWQKQLDGASPALDLPTDRIRPPVQTYNGASHCFRIGKELTQKIKDVAKASAATLYMALLAAFQVLLYRYSDQEDILVGTPAAGRNRYEFKNLLGYLVNPVVLRADLSGNPRFRGFLRQVRQTVLDALAHQDYPFPLLVEKLQPERDPSRSPLFQVMCVLQRSHRIDIPPEFIVRETGGVMDMGDLRLESLKPSQLVAPFDLTLVMTESDQGLTAALEYNTDLFDAATIERMAGHFETLLSGIAENPNQTVSDLPILTEKERHQILIEFNDTAADYPLDKTVVDLFEEQVERMPDNIAVVFEDRKLTYRELNEQANRIAHFLRNEYNIQPDDRVGILLDRSEWMIIAILAVLKAGGAYVPVDPKYPDSRIQYMFADSECRLVLAENKFQRMPIRKEVVYIRDIQHENSENLYKYLSSNQLAYVLYTSGSTGLPKGVLIEHRSVTNMVCGLQQVLYARFEDAKDKAVSQNPLSAIREAITAPFVFDVSVQQVFATLLQGNTLYVVTEDVRRDAVAFTEFLRENIINFINITPGFIGAMIESGFGENPPKSLWHIIVGADNFPSGLVKAFYSYEKCRDIFLLNMYGPTENCVNAIGFPINPDTEIQGAALPIGKPLPNVRCFILDSALNPVPIGIHGEIYLSGEGVARGYLNSSALTKEKFISHPFREGEWLYRTGDVGRWLSDGNIEFLGRNDDQVKIRGYRVELGEIENCLMDYAGVKEAKLFAGEFRGNTTELAAYITGTDGLDVGELREHLKKKLPDYMIPSYFMQLEKIPLTPNGKVDRKVLPPPAGAGIALKTEYIAPRDEAETKIAHIWQEVLEMEKIGIRDNFFDLGGHSLLLIRVQRKLQEAFHTEIPLLKLFKYPTVAALAQYLTQKHDEPQPPVFQSVQNRAEKQKQALKRQKELRG